jgi:hypothetical protein
MLTAFGAVGVQRVLLSTDLGGISASVFRAIERHRPVDARWPEVDFLDGRPIRQTAQDTVEAVRRMVTAGARVVVCLGGDGTARVAASAAGDVPMLALSTGTNNVFPAVREATIAGLAAGLVATGVVPAEGTTSRAKLLEVRVGDRTETALVDVAVSTERHVGARAVWDPATVTQLFCSAPSPNPTRSACPASSASFLPSPGTSRTASPRASPPTRPARSSPRSRRAWWCRSGCAKSSRCPPARFIRSTRAPASSPWTANASLPSGRVSRRPSGSGRTGPGAWTFPRSWRRAPASACSDVPPLI